MTFHVPENDRVTEVVCQAWGFPMGFATTAADGNQGVFMFNAPLPGTKMAIRTRLKILCVASEGLGWEHVSVSLRIKNNPKWRQRNPTHDEMKLVREKFWSPEDLVVHYWPPESDYVNCHEYTLHLWRQPGWETTLPRPHHLLVGPKASDLRRL